MEIIKSKITKGDKLIPAAYYKPDIIQGAAPLVIFLHGNGEQGDGTDRGLDRLINNNNHEHLVTNTLKRGGIVLAPQFVQAYNDDWRPEWAGGKYVDAVVDWALLNLPIDPKRIYLTGLSGGGGGCWDYISLLPEYNQKIAAVVPICGTPQSGERDWSLCAKTNLPVRAYHARDDRKIGYESTLQQVAAINEHEPQMAEMTIYDSGGHGIWGRVYQDQEMYQWLFSQVRKDSPVIIPPPEPDPKVYMTVNIGNTLITFYEDKTFDIE